MADDLFHKLSPKRLKEEIAQKVLLDQRSLPERTKIFSAVANMQGFDGWPGLEGVDDIERLIAAGQIELNRGLCGNKGVPAIFYAKELLMGPMYPGTLAAFGSGIHLSTVSEYDAPVPGFPRCAKTSLKYWGNTGTGVIVRCVLNANAKIFTSEQLVEFRRENRNRARESQLTDLGSLTAALGYDGFICDKLEANQTEEWYVIVNRTALTFQTIVLQRGHPPVENNPG